MKLEGHGECYKVAQELKRSLIGLGVGSQGCYESVGFLVD